MNELIEGYLRTVGVRYFRGHHDDEYFFLVDARAGRLYVHLEVSGADRDAVRIDITPDRYYPAAHRDEIHHAVQRWNDEEHGIGALVGRSCDPQLAGVSAGSVYRGSGAGEFSAFVDDSIAAAAELFDRIRLAVEPRHALRDAG